MLEYIYKNVKISHPFENGVEGQAVIQFVVGLDGSVPTLPLPVIGRRLGWCNKIVVESMNNMSKNLDTR